MKKILLLLCFTCLFIGCNADFWDQTIHNSERVIGEWKGKSDILVFNEDKTGQKLNHNKEVIDNFVWRFDDYDLYMNDVKYDYDNVSKIAMEIDDILYLRM